MTRRCLRLVTIWVGISALCCSGSSRRNNAAADGSVADQDGEADIVCPLSESGRFYETPSGTCEGTVSCAIELDNTCRPGVAFVPTTPSVFLCWCAEGSWQCEVKSGGLGLTPCGDAGI